MPYPPRVCFEGAVYHVTTRGDNRELIFRDDGDRRRYLELLGRYKKRFGFTLHAYALMPNHVHLILEQGAGATISKIMQALAVAYTKYFNLRHQRVGHVFQGRFRSRLIDKDVYLLVASRYVHRNPVRAKLCHGPADFAWSSYAAYVQPAADPWRLADPSTVLALITPGCDETSRQRKDYQTFVETPLPSDLISDPNSSEMGSGASASVRF